MKMVLADGREIEVKSASVSLNRRQKTGNMEEMIDVSIKNSSYKNSELAAMLTPENCSPLIFENVKGELKSYEDFTVFQYLFEELTDEGFSTNIRFSHPEE